MTLCRRRGAARLIEGDILVAWIMWRSTVAFWISCRPFYCSCFADGAVRSYRRSRRSRPPPLMCWTRPTRNGHKGWRLRVHYILPQGRMFLRTQLAVEPRRHIFPVRRMARMRLPSLLASTSDNLWYVMYFVYFHPQNERIMLGVFSALCLKKILQLV